MELKHFSHEHPLILNEGEGWHALSKILNPKQTCNGCGEQILPSLPFYVCPTSSCHYFLHQRCAHLPPEIIYPLHHENHRLTLLSRPPSRHSRHTDCNACKRSRWHRFTYHCSPCNFNIDIQCAIRASRVQRKCHRHPLIPLQNPAKFHCDACKNSEFEGPSYLCTICQFWVHQVCADWLPPTLQYEHQSSDGSNNNRGDHPLILSYTFPRDFHKFVAFCEICSLKLSRPDWVYYCPDCRYFAHPSCCIPIISRETIKEENPALPAIVEKETHLIDSNTSIVRLPLIEENRDPISIFIQSIGLGEDDDHQPIKHPFHRHQLVQADIENEDDDHILDERKKTNEVCQACYHPIYNSTPFYKCNEDPNCKFLLHKWCSQLPRQIIDHPCHPQHLLVLTTDIYGIIRCNGCKNLCQGFTFSCESCQFHLDIGCASLPRSIIHDLHNHSKLTLKEYNPTDGIRCNGCNYLLCGMAFTCEACNNFKLDKECVLLSRAIHHRYDETHPFKLMYSPVPGIEEYVCEICERAINPRQCFYCCGLCDQAIHPDCILPVGHAILAYNPGKFLNTPHHTHRIPLRESVEGHGSSCDCCGEGFIAGKKSGFECIQCSYKIHGECVDTPQFVKLKCDEHSLRLIYPSSSIEGIKECKLCQQEIDKKIWFFHCSNCDVSVHRLCVGS